MVRNKNNTSIELWSNDAFEKRMSSMPDNFARLYLRLCRMKEKYKNNTEAYNLLVDEKKKFPLTEQQFVIEYSKSKGYENHDDLKQDYEKWRKQIKIYEQIVGLEKKIEKKTEHNKHSLLDQFDLLQFLQSKWMIGSRFFHIPVCCFGHIIVFEFIN